MRRFFVFILLMLITAAPTAEWKQGEWRGQPAWVARQGGWSAVVCPAWGRLVSLQTPDGHEFLYVPAVSSLQKRVGSTAGGHLAWLGPQSRWGWPPPTHWEYRPADDVAVTGNELRLRPTQSTDQRFPVITRSYYWGPDGLHCTMGWLADQPWHGLHVFQVVDAARVSLRPLVRPGLQFGVAVAYGAGQPPARSDLALPFPGIGLERELAIIGHGDNYVKAFWPLQPIEVELGAWRLTMSRHDPIGGEEPENGLTTMTFSGPEPGMVEIEQASPVVPAGRQGEWVVLLTVGMAER